VRQTVAKRGPKLELDQWSAEHARESPIADEFGQLIGEKTCAEKAGKTNEKRCMKKTARKKTAAGRAAVFGDAGIVIAGI
jgi:hypothetical protein